jgi:hypothetical protein
MNNYEFSMLLREIRRDYPVFESPSEKAAEKAARAFAGTMSPDVGELYETLESEYSPATATDEAIEGMLDEYMLAKVPKKWMGNALFWVYFIYVLDSTQSTYREERLYRVITNWLVGDIKYSNAMFVLTGVSFDSKTWEGLYQFRESIFKEARKEVALEKKRFEKKGY